MLALLTAPDEGADILMAGDETPPVVTMHPIHHVDVPGYPAAHSPYSHAVIANGFVFVSGQIPVRPGGGPTEIVGETMQEQTRQALRNVQTILKAAGSSLDTQARRKCVEIARILNSQGTDCLACKRGHGDRHSL